MNKTTHSHRKSLNKTRFKEGMKKIFGFSLRKFPKINEKQKKYSKNIVFGQHISNTLRSKSIVKRYFIQKKQTPIRENIFTLSTHKIL